MNRKTSLTFLIAWGVSMMALGFYSSRKSAPEDLGFFRAQLNDGELIELAVDQVREHIRAGKYVVAATNGEKLHFVKKNAPARSANAAILPKIQLRATQIAQQGELATVSARLISAGNGEETTTRMTFRKTKNHWQLMDADGLTLSRIETSSERQPDMIELYREESQSETKTLARTPLSSELDLDRLTASVTNDKLDRRLFGKPFAGVLVSSVKQLNEAPFFISRYVQLVTDPAWNRIVYGDYDGWIKAYHGDADPEVLNRPHGIDRDANGNVYVADTGNNRIVVLQLAGIGHETKLLHQFEFGAGDLNLPYDVAWDDSGTPFEPLDDIIWVADTGNNRVLGYAVRSEESVLRFSFGRAGRETDEFFGPGSLTPGRFNGVCNGNLYVADTGNRRLVRLARSDQGLQWHSEFAGEAESQFTSIDADHWGNLYLADQSYGTLQKLTAEFEPLASTTGGKQSLNSPANFHNIFGQISIESEDRQVWAGYDQAFLLEKWTDNSGAGRYQLGLDLDEFQVSLSRELDQLWVSARMTDHARLTVALVDDETEQTVRQIPLGWLVSGGKSFSWNRRDDIGWQVEPGFYRLQLLAQSTYKTTTVSKETPPFYLPLYYHEDSGSDAHDDAHLSQGVRHQEWGAEPHESIASHPSDVVYRFTQLNPAVQYEMKAEFYNRAGDYLKQRIVVDEAQLTGDIDIASGLQVEEWQPLPREASSDGEIFVKFQKVAGNTDAMVSQMWLREAGYDPENPPVQHEVSEQIPEQFSLSQNYPNPFNPTTTIEFGVPAGDTKNVKMKIFNALGQTVKVLINEQLRPGRHSVVWNGRDTANRPIASGVYLYQITAGSFTQVKKLVLMK